MWKINLMLRNLVAFHRLQLWVWKMALGK
jgi:hypothetical protein